MADDSRRTTDPDATSPDPETAEADSEATTADPEATAVDPDPTPDRGDAEPGDPTSPRSGDRPRPLVHGLIGGVLAVVFAFLPFSPALGGGVAGYLGGGTLGDGAKAGAVAGVVAFVPIVLVAGAALVFVPVVAVPDPGFSIGIWLVALVFLLLLALYTVGLGVLGGALGAYLKAEL